MLSTWRPGAIVASAIEAALCAPDVCSVHVWGYEPTGRAVHHSIPDTLYHAALREELQYLPLSYLAQGNKFAGTDARARVKWRATLALDTWAVLREARTYFPTQTLLWLENDAVVDAPKLAVAVSRLKRSGSPAAACYGQGPVYGGAGNVCFLLTPAADVLSHILAYHMVHPVDWIISDYSAKTWPIFEAASHGFPGRTHASTRDL